TVLRAARGRLRARGFPAGWGAKGTHMSKNLYVGNLPFQTTADDLREAFEQFGPVTRAQVISDKETGRSRGFGFVEMENGADEAVSTMNGAQYQGRTLTVNEARPREERPAGGFGGGRGGDRGGDRGGRGGYGGGRRY